MLLLANPTIRSAGRRLLAALLAFGAVVVVGDFVVVNGAFNVIVVDALVDDDCFGRVDFFSRDHSNA